MKRPLMFGAMVVVSALSISLVVWESYRLLDAATEIDDCRQQQRHQRARENVLLVLTEKTRPISKGELIQLLRDRFGAEYLIAEKSPIRLEVEGGLVFTLDGENVTGVSTLEQNP